LLHFSYADLAGVVRVPASRTAKRIKYTDDQEGCLWDRACNLFTIWLWLPDDVERSR
jgi:hypothetical protein